MEWWWDDPERGEPTQWWSIDPHTGKPNGAAVPVDNNCHALGDCPLDAAGEAAEAIEISFGASRCFSEEETRALLLDVVVPPSFRGGPEDAAELLELVEGLWIGVERCYQQALHRSPTQVERQWLFAFAFEILRPSGRKRA
jgi:hypothetical protein